MADSVSKRHEARAFIFGSRGAGKTTLMQKLHSGTEFTKDDTTASYTVRTVEYGAMDLSMLVVPTGRTIKRVVWREYLQNASIIIFIVDSTDMGSMCDALYILPQAARKYLLRNCPFLILANKQDQPGAVGVATVVEKLKLDSLKQKWHVAPTCLTTGEGLIEGLSWAIRQIDPEYEQETGSRLGQTSMDEDQRRTNVKSLKECYQGENVAGRKQALSATYAATLVSSRSSPSSSKPAPISNNPAPSPLNLSWPSLTDNPSNSAPPKIPAEIPSPPASFLRATPVCRPQSPDSLSDLSPSCQPPKGKHYGHASPKATITTVSVQPETFRTPLKANWELPVLTKPIVVIGSSNTARITQSPHANVQILSFPGAKFRHFKSVFDKYKGSYHPKSIVLSLGPNNRQSKPITSIPEMKSMVLAAAKTFPHSQVYFPKLNICEQLPDLEKQNLHAINQAIEDLKGRYSNVSILESLNPEKFHTGRDNIHWTESTANDLLKLWFTHLS